MGRPKHPKSPPPKKIFSREKKLRHCFFCVLRPQEDVFAKKNSITKLLNDCRCTRTESPPVRMSLCMLMAHKGHDNTMHVYSVIILIHFIVLEAVKSQLTGYILSSVHNWNHCYTIAYGNITTSRNNISYIYAYVTNWGCVRIWGPISHNNEQNTIREDII